MNKLTAVFAALALLCVSLAAQTVSFTDAWSEQGLSLAGQSLAGVDIDYSIEQLTFSDVTINGRGMTTLSIPGVILPNDEGAPNLPSESRWVAIPQGAKATVTITASRVETYHDLLIAPAPRIPLETEDGPLEYNENPAIYGADAFYPANPVMVSDPTLLRGVDAVIVGVTPFQYNPVTRELRVYRDLQIHVDFVGGGSHIGEDRLRSQWWDPILEAAFINAASLPVVDYPVSRDRTPDYEYVILTPDNAEYLAWADSLSRVRNKQGIATGIVTTTEIGGGTAGNIENFIDNALADWDVPPVAMLILGDYGIGDYNVTSPVWDSYCISDNFYADATGNDLPDIAVARMTANNEAELAIMMEKAINYEYDPPTSPDFYSNPIIAGGWQTERWFILCTEVVHGFMVNELNKTPVREYAIYSGSPGGTWSTNQNTNLILNYFGPNGLGYIPSSPSELNDWGGNATRINADINAGSFMMLHRDHGSEDGWGEPDYDKYDLPGLVDNEPVYVFSINCLTGKFNHGSESFAEAFHRHEDRALGIIAATEVSYSFVNDTYVWGMMDLMWPEFMPDNGENGPHNLLPAFGNAYGKIFLAGSNWPYNASNKEVTYYLFHAHGDAFTRLYEEVPQSLTVNHLDVLPCGLDFFEVTADEGADICLSVDGQIIGEAIGTGAPVNVTIEPQFPPAYVDITVTMQNYSRYETSVMVVPLDAPFLIHDSAEIVDSNGASQDGILDYSDGDVGVSLLLENVGEVAGSDITVNITCTDEYVTITDGEETGVSTPGQTVTTIEDAFAFDIDTDVPDMHVIEFEWTATDGTDTWDGSFEFTAHAPILELGGFEIDDSATGNDNGRMDAGETVDVLVTIRNVGSSSAYEVYGGIATNDIYATATPGPYSYGQLDPEDNNAIGFSVSSSENAPIGHMIEFDLDISAEFNYATEGGFHFPIGQIPVLIINWESGDVSAQAIINALAANDVSATLVNDMPEELNIYTSIFVCLGIQGTAHELTTDESSMLEAFLLQGGKLYMEGGDTWYADTQTDLHDYFHLNSDDNGSGNLGPIIGQSGTFAQGMNFGYTGGNVSIDHLTPVAPAFAVFRNYNPTYGCMVAYDEGNYQTIGSSFRFGNLINGVYNKTQLMAGVLDFFNISGTPMGNVNGAVTLSGAGNVEDVDITIGTFVIHPDDDGAFSVDLAPGTYEFSVGMEGYETITESIQLEEYDVVVRNWNLCVMNAPGNLDVTVEAGEATFTWDAASRSTNTRRRSNQRDFLCYNIYLSQDGGDFENIDTTTETSYVTSPPQFCVNEYYITAQFDGGESEPSNTVEVVVLTAPGTLEAASDQHDAILTWTGYTDRLDFDAYRIYRDGEVVHEVEDINTLTWTDADLPNADYEYYVTSVWGDYESDPTNTEPVQILETNQGVTPFVTELGVNYPNPFNPVTTIPFSLAQDKVVTITIYNILGQTVRTYDLGAQPTGAHTVMWNGVDDNGAAVSSGIYFVRMQAGDYTEVRKAILMK